MSPSLSTFSSIFSAKPQKEKSQAINNIMSWYNKLSDLEVNEKLKAWHFRVKIIRIHSYHIFEDGPFWSYILADEAGTKTEMVIYPSKDSRFKGLEEQEGKWVKIFRVHVEKAYAGFKPVNSPFKLSVMDGTIIKRIEPLNNYHYMDFKCMEHIPHINIDTPIDIMGVVFNVEPLAVCWADRKRSWLVFHIRDNMDEWENTRGLGVVIVVLKMWRIHKHLRGDDEAWLETHRGLSGYRFNPRMVEVDNFTRLLANNDLYVSRYGAIVPL